MQLLSTVAALRQQRDSWRQGHESVALVPTMGALHEGHLSLVEQAAQRAEQVVVSIFVNPLQFDRADDLAAYPRTLESDLEKLQALPVSAVFAPEASEVYPLDQSQVSRVHVPELGEMLEGEHRPGHFDGVATVVLKLFNLVQPDVAIFGEKDFQQQLVIRKMVADLNIPVNIESAATLREADGLAMSSRNRRLDADERRKAPALYRRLQRVVEKLVEGESDHAFLQQEAMAGLEISGLRPEYVAVRRKNDLGVPQSSDRALVVLGAAWLGEIRLIDNITIDL